MTGIVQLVFFLSLSSMAPVLQIANAGEQDPPLCLSYEEAATRDLDVESMRAANLPALVVDSETCAFPNRVEEAESAVEEFQRELVRLLGAETPVKGTILSSLVFFDEEGKMQHFFYRGLDLEKGKQICEIVHRLADGYTFPLKSTRPFYCCTTVRIP